MSEELREAVMRALHGVLDPCSVATRRPMSIVDLGLLVDLAVGPEGDVRVVLRATSPSCVLIGSIMEAAETRVGAIPGVASVSIALDVTSDWTPERMTADGAASLEAARRRARSMQAAV
jgi:metal-sulfur cluster biosynthetic enzyme